MENRKPIGLDKKRWLPVFELTLFCLCVSDSASHADLTIVSRTTFVDTRMKSLPARFRHSPKTYTNTTYYKGAKIRKETGKGYVSLYDTKTGKSYSLNTADKTYTVTSPASDAADPMNKVNDSKTTLSLKSGGKKRIIVGKRATNYQFQETTLLGRKPSAVRKGNAIDEGSLIPNGPKVYVVDRFCEAWITNQVKLTGIVATSWPSLMNDHVTTDADELTKPLADRLTLLRGCLLFSRTTEAGASVEQINAEIPQYPTINTYEVVSLKETPLPDKLFAIPADYKQVKKKPVLSFGSAAQ